MSTPPLSAAATRLLAALHEDRVVTVGRASHEAGLGTAVALTAAKELVCTGQALRTDGAAQPLDLATTLLRCAPSSHPENAA
jgi:hypothetical protein